MGTALGSAVLLGHRQVPGLPGLQLPHPPSIPPEASSSDSINCAMALGQGENSAPSP